MWEIQPPSLAELTRQALAGPTRTLHLPDGKVVEESVDWPDWQVTAWKAWQLLTLVLIGVPGHILLWAEQRPSRFLALLSIVGLAVFLGWYGGEIAATTPEVTP
ncbi:hypothetical protein [Pseudonocardia sp. NPDC049635]|uniref:hypothetical protein n=1 Tax=Pseudonocardia sp. NPDC049635 TaxID=3155506 RepID=UPI0034114D6B